MGSIRSLKTLAKDLPVDGKLMPVLFVGHGSPMNAIEDNEFSQRWRKMAEEVPVPKAVLCISAHWLTQGTFVTAMESPRTIHDFGGFPQELFQAQYPAPGSPELADQASSLVKSTTVGLDHDWGLDHGCWSVVKQMYPHAEIPVLQFSIDYHKPPQYHYDLGKELFELRKKGVLILGSGNMIHNLRMIGAPPGESFSMMQANNEYGYDWALELNSTFKRLVSSNDYKTLIQYEQLGEAAKLAIPTPDHYYPLLYSIALQYHTDEIEIFNDKCVAGSLSMTSVKWG